MQIENPYLLFLGDARDQLAAKTAAGIVDWRPGWCLGQLRLPGCGADLGIDDMTVAEAKAAGVRTMVIGVVNPGGTLPDHWVDVIVQLWRRVSMSRAACTPASPNSIGCAKRPMPISVSFSMSAIQTRHSALGTALSARENGC